MAERDKGGQNVPSQPCRRKPTRGLGPWAGSDPLETHWITAFLDPQDDRFSFETVYQLLSDRGFVIYPGRLTQLSTFRIGNIGWLFPSDLEQLVLAVRET